MNLSRSPQSGARRETANMRGVSGHSRSVYTGFTLIEILVSMAIIGVLLSLVLPIVGKTAAASRGFKCQQSLRSVAYDFTMFADDTLHGPRGSDAVGRTFSVRSFVDSQYCVNDFWCWPGETRHDLPDASGVDPIRCPEVKGSLTLRSNAPCTSGGVSPPQYVSYGFNLRLQYAEVNGGLSPLRVTSEVLQHPNVPLAWDIDGEVAADRQHTPMFTAPGLDSTGALSGDEFWFPSKRHNGSANFAFIDGHVESSMSPLTQTSWDWAFTPRH